RYYLVHSPSFFFECAAAHRDLHSFPTRRSSDLEPTDSGWYVTSGPDLPLVRQSGDVSCDCLVIGAGWMGLHAARRFAELNADARSEEHTSELQSRENLVCRLLLEKKKKRRKAQP